MQFEPGDVVEYTTHIYESSIQRKGKVLSVYNDILTMRCPSGGIAYRHATNIDRLVSSAKNQRILERLKDV